MKILPRRFLISFPMLIFGAVLSGCGGGGGGTVLLVNSPNDVNDGVCDSSHCSLREAINKANTLSGTVTIKFNIYGGGVQTIRPESFLPDIFATVIIDGTSQPGYSGTPLIELDGSLAGVADGLQIRGNNSTVKGLAVNRFSRDGIRIRAQFAKIVGNYIGTDVTGTLDMGNGANGVDVCCEFTAPPQAAIGGTAPQERNVISANHSSGISLDQHYPGFTHVGWNLVQGNFIGTDATGTVALGNNWDGILIDGSSDNIIGGNTAGSGNVISANGLSGITVTNDAADNNVIKGNYIGTDLNGTADLGNSADGVNLVSADDIQIGGGESGARNVISGNQLRGVRIDGASDGAMIYGNYIGTDASGTSALPNVKAGIVVDGADHEIGGPDEGKGNLISGNLGPGIAVLSTAAAIVIKNNYIGTDAAGMGALGNGTGIEVGMGSGATDVRIGGAVIAPHQGNLISGNVHEGILLYRGAKVWGNKIGTDATGSGPLGNGGDGILVKGSDNQIGAVNSGNTIAYNGQHGVAVITEFGTAVHNAIQVNSIHDNGMLGIALDEDTVLPNDDLDADTGDNDRQNYPVLISAFADLIAGSTTIEGELNSKPNTEYSIEFFSNAECDPSGFGEGHSMFQKLTLTTDAQGYGHFNELVAMSVSFSPGNFFTVTATDPDRNTSGFSNCIALTTVPPVVEATGAPPPPMTYKPFFEPAEIKYGTRCFPDTVRISVEIGNPPEPIHYVLLFVRLMEKKGGGKTEWGGGFTMIGAGKNRYYYDVSAYEVPGYNSFEEAWLQFQFVVYNKNQEKIGYSEVFGDITLLRCSAGRPNDTG
jgi:CSLREA domain-containing protein